MGQPDQCPSKGKFEKKPRKFAPESVGVAPTGRSYWRGLDDLADTQDFRDWLEREFPAGASELLQGSRRSFLKVMGASVALAGAAGLPGCRRPDHKIMPYSREVPEETIPGKPLFFATSIAFPGGAVEGLLVETHENRPTKIEGNPLHPINRGRSSAWAQASVLGVYDPDRLKDCVFTDADKANPLAPRSWADFDVWSKGHFPAYDADQGRGLAFIVDRKPSPSLRAMRARIMQRWPRATWVWYDALQVDEVVRGSEIAFGSAQHEMLHLDKARVIVSLDRDFLGCEGRGVVHAREFAATRRMLRAGDEMSRLYAVESYLSATGGKADHRMRLAPSQVTAFAAALYRMVMAKAGQPVSGAAPAVPEDWQKWLDAIGEDIENNPGRSLFVAGNSQPAAVHAMAHAMNAALRNVGTTVSYAPMSEEDAASSAAAMTALAGEMDAGRITTVVTVGANPVYNAPAELRFAERFAKVPMRITLSVEPSETVEASNWRLSGAHELESWGDTQTADGVIAPTQPMIAPIYGGKSDLELLALVAGDSLADADGHRIVRETWQQTTGTGDFDRRWRRALHDGVLAGTGGNSGRFAPSVRMDAVGQAAGALSLGVAPASGSLEVVFYQNNMADGRYANNAWLQELPESTTRIVWDNAALVSPATARALGLMPQSETTKHRGAAMADLTVDGRTLRIAVWPVPGIADNTVVLPLGYGRAVTGRVGEGTGFNTFAVRTSATLGAAAGATLRAAAAGPRLYPISTTQSHGSMEGRALVRELDHQAWQKHGDDPIKIERDAYGREKRMPLGERLEGSETTHTPSNVSIYKNPYNKTRENPIPEAAYAKGPQWGMSIDLSTCTGCGVCTIACAAENNIPVVGKIEVSKGREMTWIRVDRYFNGADEDHVDATLFQPVPCVHCENAPCETVCPVNATVHGPEGINYMAYNRCIGTRYCANNCPYKVRRFNFFDYGPAQFNGDYVGKDKVPEGIVHNPNLVPPRLRERMSEIKRMGQNPDVTVRSRGVMEKCSYCIQRINEVRIEAKLTDLQGIPDGMMQTACQQACPTESIAFGDILDITSNDGQGSVVRRMRDHNRTYALLGFLNTRPRTTYMAGVRNPSPRLRTPNTDPFVGHHGDDHGGGHGEGHGHDDHGHSHHLPAGDADPGVKVSLTVLGGLA